MDIMAKIEEIIGKLTSDKDLLTKFQENPVQVVEGLVGADLPDEQINQIVDGVKAKVAADGAADGILGAINNILGK